MHFDRAMALDPYFPDMWLHFQAQAAFQLRRYEMAIGLLNRRITRNPDTDASRVLLAASYGAMGRNEEARAMWEETFRVNPDYSLEHRRKVLPYKNPAEVMKKAQIGFTRYLTGNDPYEGPEATAISERCLIGFGGTGGPGMLSVLYNNNYQFVQTPDYLMVLVEMAHDVRIIPIFATAEKARAGHKPNVITPWLGDGVAWWVQNWTPARDPKNNGWYYYYLYSVEKAMETAGVERLATVEVDMAGLRAMASETLAGSESGLALVRDVLVGTQQIAAAAQETSGTASESAAAARQQARAAEDLAAAIEEIASLADELQVAES